MRSNRVLIAVTLIAVIGYLFLATWDVRDPGVQYDELAFGNSTLGILDHSFVFWAPPVFGKNIPVMLVSYTGAVKSYVYFPVVRLFGTSPEALRIPVILLGALALLLYVAIARRIAGTRTAVLFALLLAVDPSYLYHIRLDWGPVAIMMVLKAAGLFTFLHWWDKRGIGWLASSGFIFGVGVFDKVNFLWFLGAAGLACLLVYRKELMARATLKNLIVFFGAMFIGALPVLLYNVAFPLATIREPFEAAGTAAGATTMRRFVAMAETLLGVAVFKFVNSEDISALWSYLPFSGADGLGGAFSALSNALTSAPGGRGSLMLIAFVLALIFLLGSLFKQPRGERRALSALLLGGAIIFAEILITRKANGSHHMMMLYPLPQLLVAMAVSQIWGAASVMVGSQSPESALAPVSTRRMPAPVWRTVGALAIVAVVGISSLLVDASYLKYFSTEGGKGIWSNAIYDLVGFAGQKTDSRFVLLDWGFNTQFLTLSRGKIRKDEAYHTIGDGDFERKQFQIFLDDPTSVFVFHSPKYTVFPRSRQLFEKLVADAGMREEILQRFYQGDGEEVYFVSRVVK